MEKLRIAESPLCTGAQCMDGRNEKSVQDKPLRIGAALAVLAKTATARWLTLNAYGCG
jgi:hypothetical protein